MPRASLIVAVLSVPAGCSQNPGEDSREPSPWELAQMQQPVTEAIGGGAFGQCAGVPVDIMHLKNPPPYPVGIEYITVNGTPALEKNRHVGTKLGRILQGKGWRA